jgi:hypothetical protein
MENKKAVYNRYNIVYKDGKILSPIGYMGELLKEGNSKTGKAVLTWSLLPGTVDFTVDGVTVRGTCCCDCVGCYAMTGFYKMGNVVRSMHINTRLVNEHIDFVSRAIRAQLETTRATEVRIHAAGDFNTARPDEYANMWHDIARDFPSIRFWTYTKVSRFESLFDGLDNANIVRSVIPHVGVNFGTCEYIINAYYTLLDAGQDVYICKCGIDDSHHCAGCHMCSAHKYVLFLEHSTAYNAKLDPLYSKLCALVMSQDNDDEQAAD